MKKRYRPIGGFRSACLLILIPIFLLAGCGSDGAGSAPPMLSVVSSNPGNGASSVDLSLTMLTVTFNRPVATTFDPGTFTWPHLVNVSPFVLLQNKTALLPVSLFLDNDPNTNSIFLFLLQPPEGGDLYELTLLQGLPVENGLSLNASYSITFTMSAPDFGGGVFANRIVAYTPELPAGETLNQGFYNPESVLGQTKGSLHVTSLGDDRAGNGGSIILGFGDGLDGVAGTVRQCITDGPGNDFIVHENPFSFTDPSGAVNFTEGASVEVSQDNITYFPFPATFPAADPNLVGKPGQYANMAGINVGGDGFDLANLTGLPAGFEACYVKIIDGGANVPDYDSDGAFASNSHSGADIDAVEALQSAAAPGLTP